jgi:hypothetical protein
MKLDEIVNPPLILLEGKRLAVYESILPLLLIEDGDGGGGDGGGDAGGSSGPPPSVGDSTGGSGDITGEPVKSPDVTPSTPTGGWGRGPLIGFGGGRWFNELYNSVKNLMILSRLSKRLKDVGVSKQGTLRVQNAAKTAAKNVKLLLSNPGATAYRIPQWTFDKPKSPKIKRWNEGFAYEFKKELAKLNENQMLD